jgi:hypothetical protein
MLPALFELNLGKASKDNLKKTNRY